MNKLLLVSLFALIILGIASCQSKEEKNSNISLYIGTYTDGESEGIYHAKFDTVHGTFSPIKIAARIKNPSFLTLTPDKKKIIAVSEHTNDSPNIYSFSINKENGLLTPLDSITTGGLASCYISVIDENLIAIANYISGDVSFVSITPNGRFSGSPKTFIHSGSGPNKERQEAPHAHSIAPGPNNKYIYSADLGIDKIMIYRNENGMIYPNSEIKVLPGAGPRHIAFHPKGKYMALLNELSHSIDLFTPDSEGVFSEHHSNIQLLEDSLHNDNKSADIHFSEDGKHLYASIRGVDRIDILEYNQMGNEYLKIGSSNEKISWPRNFATGPSTNYLLVANRNANNITVLNRNFLTGELSATKNQLIVDQPVCIAY